MGGSSSRQSSKPVNMTPEEFRRLQGPFADVLGRMVRSYVPEGTQAIMGGYQGPLTAQPTTGEQQILGQLQQTATQQQQQGPFQLGPAPTAQQIGPAGQALTGQLLGGTALSGMSPQGVNQFVQGLGFGPTQSLGEFTQGIAGASGTGAFGGENPFLQAAIEAAQRPVLQGLEETLSRTLPGRFTQAGQFIQPGGSSAFDRAAALATRGVAQELGDISSQMSYAALEAARGREAGALEAELARRGQFGLAEQQAKQAQLDRALQVPGMLSDLTTAAQQRELMAAQGGLTEAQRQATGAGVQSQEVDTLIKNLQAQALPRLIQDLGIERGMEAFNNQVNALLSTLGITAGVTRPVISQESSGKSSSFSLK